MGEPGKHAFGRASGADPKAEGHVIPQPFVTLSAVFTVYGVFRSVQCVRYVHYVLCVIKLTSLLILMTLAVRGIVLDSQLPLANTA